MKKLSILTSILFALGLYMVPATFATGGSADSKDKQSGQSEYQKDQKGQSQAQQSRKGQQSQQFQQQKQNLVLADKLNGAEVQNQQGENIGEIDRILVDVQTGRVGFVTLVSGGILGVGDDKYIVPFNALQVSQGTEAQVGDQLRFTLNKSKDQLKKVPEGDIEEALSQDDQSRGIFEHYGVSPYWDDNQRKQNRQDHTQGQMMQDRNKDQMMENKDQQKKQ